METQTKLVLSPNGNGGLFQALFKQGIITDMEKRGIHSIHVYCVDNCLVKVADPVFIGYCVEKNSDCAIKCVPKLYEDELVGIICLKNEKPGAVEYSEMNDYIKYAKNDHGTLMYNHANIANHYFTLEFLKRAHTINLKHHIARKKIPHFDLQSGKYIKPATPNGIKLELFIFDILPFAERFSVLEVSRLDEFSPLKNKDGDDSPNTCREDIFSQSKRYLESKGHTDVANNIEISPLILYGNVDF